MPLAHGLVHGFTRHVLSAFILTAFPIQVPESKNLNSSAMSIVGMLVDFSFDLVFVHFGLGVPIHTTGH